MCDGEPHCPFGGDEDDCPGMSVDIAVAKSEIGTHSTSCDTVHAT